MTTYTKIETGETWTTRNIGVHADRWFVGQRSIEINARSNEKKVNTARVEYRDGGAYVRTSDSGKKERFDLLVKFYTVTQPEPSAARIDTLMDGGRNRMGMLR